MFWDTCAAKDIQLEHLDFYMLGRQLAQSDICAYSSALENKELTEFFNNRFTPITEDYLPISLQNWPNDPVFNSNLYRYVSNRRRFSESKKFILNPLVYLMQSIVCPSVFPSTAWCWQDWEKSEPWQLFFAGALFPKPILITVKDQNDRAVITLFEIMKRDKEKSVNLKTCGKIPRKELWPEKSLNTQSKAWDKLTKDTLPKLGAFEFDGGRGKNKGTGGRCRLPVAFAKPDCRIFIEKLKEDDFSY